MLIVWFGRKLKIHKCSLVDTLMNCHSLAWGADTPGTEGENVVMHISCILMIKHGR